MGMTLLVLHGPSLTFLKEFEGLDGVLRLRAASHGLALKIVQSNHEGVLIDTLQAERRGIDGVVVNPAGLFSSYPLRDALETMGVPVFEVHLEGARAKLSVLKEVCTEQFSGKGADPYLQAIDQFIQTKTSAGGGKGKAAAVSKMKTLGRKIPREPKASPSSPAGKTLGRSAKALSSEGMLSRKLIRQKIAERLAGKLSAAELATWARMQWMEVQRGAPAESGYRDMLEDSLQTLTLSTMPASRLTDEQLVDLMAQLEG
ncbi:type II 3-dehydroquinate dehydratase [Stigmatella sp. ncwal1]|uniref:3-dehydroquinate dehydratase n=1 Tax=Stigmatella ashevillensis TaxID=2995309 RepID=A0ABT5DLD3_9BACT|nr:type II 3-dehydroquinate dehydratase [Stigmatella ashevillena]MDC0713938.1 type II 3-dehydroquinate dehydratase [Stigmatella ashevillena]